MRIQANTDLHQHSFDLLEQISLTIPNHFSAIDQIDEIKVQIQSTNFHQMLDQLIIEFIFDLQVTYNGINHLTYTLNQPLTRLQKVEKPRGNVIQIFTENITLHQDYQLKLPKPKSGQIRQFDLLLFLQVQYYLGANLKRTGPTALPTSQATSTTNTSHYSNPNFAPDSSMNPHSISPIQQPFPQTDQPQKRKWQHNGLNWYK